MTKCDKFPSLASHKIEIKKPTSAINEIGETIETFVSLGTFWAIIRPARPNELFVNEQLRSKVSSVMTIRYNSVLKDTAIASQCKITFDSRDYSVLGIRNIKTLDGKMEGNFYQELYCKENDQSV